MNVKVIRPLKIAVIGSGISGLSCAWLLNQNHNVTLFEKDDRPGGHSNTVDVNLADTGSLAVDTGFIVFNPVNYPNLVKFFDQLQVESIATEMSFAVSMDQGLLEYSGTSLNGLFAQRRNLMSPTFWKLIKDLLHFYKHSDSFAQNPANADLSLGELLHQQGYSNTFIYKHLIPMGAAIWSTPANKMLDYPALTFLRFCQNHGLVQLTDRPQWRTVVGGSREYVNKIIHELKNPVRLNSHIHRIHRHNSQVILEDLHGKRETFDHVVMACHADQALEMLAEPTADEQQLLQLFPYQRNRAILHSDPALMPKRRAAWASWNYLASSVADQTADVSVTYWMNSLQHLPEDTPLFVTLNPIEEPEEGSIHRSFLYDHPAFNLDSVAAQRKLWNLQGVQNTWYCGAWFGYGFHEDGLQSGLAVAEALGGKKRPWHLDNPNSRIHVRPRTRPESRLCREAVA
ncbi:NAD(P)/FAD-dependent oxidoreductase [Nitrincola iocasae]|uniref:FAD-dependent oxidoreductase n=1 Tax=Nitrincola iocasae TaxID=2614693 RepID=A0A5J6LBU4_9GAMM|nr:FAD-dependent oxidoreductase [Nitrincola iocasae]QEW06154.1 FAD-dependent oxidoreductase [Nitrincola iocasae]